MIDRTYAISDKESSAKAEADGNGNGRGSTGCSLRLKWRGESAMGRHPWGGVEIGEVETSELPGHEFHYSKLNNSFDYQQYAYQVNRGYGINGQNDGIVYKNLLACYAHQRNTLQNQWISSFLEFVKTHT